MAKLILISQNPPIEYELKDFTTIGRMPRNTIQILDRLLSKVHTQIIKLQDGRYLIKDLGSLNGTYIKGQRITEQVLQNADEISLGVNVLRFIEEQQNIQVSSSIKLSKDEISSEIHQKLDAEKGDLFLPEAEIKDTTVLRGDYERLRISHEVATDLGIEADLSKLLSKIMDKFFEIFNADRGIIFLPDDKGEMVPAVLRTRKPKEHKKEDIIVSKTILNSVIKNKEAILTSDAAMDSRFTGAHSIIMQGIHSTMSVPMIHRNKLLGVVYLDSQLASGIFSKKDLKLLNGIAAQAASAIANSNLVKQIEHEAKTRTQFEKLLSPNLVDQLIDGSLQLDQEGRLKEVTMLFADIRGFTSMSENMQAEDIVKMLNSYFEVMVDVIFKYNGTLDKFVGDEIMALFGAPVTIPFGPHKAVECAIEMQASLDIYNTQRVTQGLKPIKIGIGVNTGEVVCGALGSSKTMQYTVVGDPVNTASRFCSIAKPGQVIIGQSTYEKVKDYFDFEILDPVKVKGKSQPLQVYSAIRVKSGVSVLTHDANTNTVIPN